MKRRAYQLKRRAESAEETRRRLVQATFELHGEQGIAATTMKQIAERAGVGIGTVYHHFPTLDDTIMACGQMVMATYPPPTEAIFAGVPTMKERLLRLVRALFEYYDNVAFDLVRADEDRLPIVRTFVGEELQHRIALTRAALAPFAIDRDLIRTSAALLDVRVCRSLQQIDLTRDQAAEAIAEIIHARLVRKD
ncbi:TetR/AcrR family transcriptional regulator [Dongia deserti]|uniref:TetR/AcrR family transcriptional regulator n=1 Tax=Dongia deserti TaxID=2268030 RepID=UPI000E658708|nr:TetR/AcrR family transcriptional regulator [Dongia deserti]